MTSQPLTKTRITNSGFTLTELLVAALISMITATVAGEALIAHLKSSEKAESMERQRENWSRAATFIEAEIALSERVFDLTTNSSILSIPSECSTQLGSTIENDQLRLGLDQSRLQKPVIYFVKASDTGWLPNFTLWRCGPDFNNLGQPLDTDPKVSIILDGLDGTSLSTAGFKVSALGTNNKAVSFTITLKGHALSQAYKQTDASQARILPLFSRPNDYSLCIGNSYVKLAGDSGPEDDLKVADGEINEGEDILICGYGGGDTITGSDNANDILDGGEDGGTTGALIIGKSGNDRLRGTTSGDILDGGDDDDVLIGRSGDDHLIGGCGVNQYLTGEGNDTVYGNGLEYTLEKGSAPSHTGGELCGSKPLDIVFYPGKKSDYIVPSTSNCTTTTCNIRKVVNGVTISNDTLKGVEVIIFDDARLDLPSP